MKDPKYIAALQVFAGILIMISGAHNLNYFETGFLDDIGMTTMMALLQFLGGPAFIHMGYKTFQNRNN